MKIQKADSAIRWGSAKELGRFSLADNPWLEIINAGVADMWKSYGKHRTMAATWSHFQFSSRSINDAIRTR